MRILTIILMVLGSFISNDVSIPSEAKEKVSQFSYDYETSQMLIKIERFRRPEKFYNKQFITGKKSSLYQNTIA